MKITKSTKPFWAYFPKGTKVIKENSKPFVLTKKTKARCWTYVNSWNPKWKEGAVVLVGNSRELGGGSFECSPDTPFTKIDMPPLSKNFVALASKGSEWEFTQDV